MSQHLWLLKDCLRCRYYGVRPHNKQDCNACFLKEWVFPQNAKQEVLDLGGTVVEDIEKYIIELK